MRSFEEREPWFRQLPEAFRSLHVYRGGCPVACCLPLVLVLVTEPGCCGSFMLEGGMLVGLGCPAERANTGGNRPLCDSLRGGRLALRRVNPRSGGGWARIALPHCLQLVHPRADSGKTLLPAPSRFATKDARSLHFPPAEVGRGW